VKNYIITGGAGFIGSAIAGRLIKSGVKVHVIDDLSTGFERNIPAGAIFYKADISVHSEIDKLPIPHSIDAVFHLAAQSSGEASFDDPLRDADINYKGTYNMLNLAKKKGAKRFIYASSMSVYGEIADRFKAGEERICRPSSYYGCNKLASEKMISVFAGNAGIEYTILRLFSVYGPGQNMFNMKQGIVSIYMSYLLKDKPVHVKGDLGRFRDLVYIDDVVEAFAGCMENRDSFGRIFNIGTGRKTTVKKLLEIILEAYGKKDFGKWVHCEGSTAGDVRGCVADVAKVRRILKWKAKYDLREGIGNMKEWLDQTKDLWVK
jgi:UDP-glucose 4-epimerase